MLFMYCLQSVGKKPFHHDLHASYAQNHGIYDNFFSWSQNHGIHNILWQAPSKNNLLRNFQDIIRNIFPISKKQKHYNLQYFGDYSYYYY